MADDVGEVRDFGLARDGQSCAEIVPEGDAELCLVLVRPRKASRQSRPVSLLVPALTLRLVTWQRMSFSDPLVWSGICE